jgi:hypothetical protein
MNQSFTHNKSSHGRFRGASKTSKNSRLCEPRGTFTAHGFEGAAKPFVQVFKILRPGEMWRGGGSTKARPPGRRTPVSSSQKSAIKHSCGTPKAGAASGLPVVKLTTQADRHNSICFGWRRWGAYLRRNDRMKSLTKRDSSPALMITDVSNHNDVSESGFTTTPSA